MAESDHWLPYLAYLMQRTTDPAVSKDDQLQAIFDYFEAVDALAEDTLADPEDRWLACEIQAMASSHARHNTGAVLAALSKFAADQTKEPEDRAEARALLKHAAETLKKRGADISKWVDPGTSRRQ
jgi:hypothetical protein